MDENYLTRIANAMEKKYGPRKSSLLRIRRATRSLSSRRAWSISCSRMRKERIPGWRIFNPAGSLGKWPY